MGKRFALIGAAGYIAPRHMKAIRDVGGKLVAAVDPHDSVGVIDSYFPNCAFFTEIERFDRHLEKLRIREEGVDYVSICSPNYLHDSHCRLALRNGADAICEKPLVLSIRNLDMLRRLEESTGRKVYTILQLRLNENLRRMANTYRGDKYYVTIDYVTPRGLWYQYSWKGDVHRSGGLATNIGVHLFDLVTWMFGGRCSGFTSPLYADGDNRAVCGVMELDTGTLVNFNLRIKGEPIRSMKVMPLKLDFCGCLDGEVIEAVNLSDGFTELHTRSYEEILNGNGFGIDDCEESIRICERIRNLIGQDTGS